MTATAAKYRPPFISQKRKDTPPYDDCAIESGLMLLGAWTLGEGLLDPDGDTKPLHGLSESLRRKIGDTSGGLTLADVDDALHVLDADLPPLPRYPGQNPPPAPSATLRLSWPEFRARVIDGSCAILLGYQPGASIGHAIFVARGNVDGPIVMDPWENRPLTWDGERWTWERLKAFTERKHDGHRYGSVDAIACAMVNIGSETTAARQSRKAAVTMEKLVRQNEQLRTAKSAAEADLRDERASHALARRALAACEAQSLRWKSDLDRATGELDVLRPAVTDLRTKLDACEERPMPDCAAIEAERDGALERATQEQERARIATEDANMATNRAVTAEAIVDTVRRAVGCM